MFAYKIRTDMKNTGIVNLVMQKIDFWGSTLGEFRGDVAPSKYVEIFVCSVSVDIKTKLAPYIKPNKKLLFDGSILGDVPRGYSQMMSKHSSLRYVVIKKEKPVP